MSGAIESMSKTDLAGAYQRALGRMKNVREEAKAITERTVSSMVTVGSGWATGALRGAIGEGAEKKVFIPGTAVEVDLAAGLVATLAGVAGLAGDQSKHLVNAGSGILAAYAGIHALHNPIK